MSAEPEPSAHAASATNQPASPAAEPRLPILRFSLRHLFWFVTVVGILLAGILKAPGPSFTPLILLMAALVVAFHVASTALGTRLRAHADQQRAWQAAQRAATLEQSATAPPSAGVSPPRVSTPSLLHIRGGRRMTWLPLLVAAGAVIGGCCGAVLIANSVGQRSSAIGVAVGAISTAVVGGWFAFLGGSFWLILRQAWRDAVAEERRDKHGS